MDEEAGLWGGGHGPLTGLAMVMTIATSTAYPSEKSRLSSLVTEGVKCARKEFLPDKTLPISVRPRFFGFRLSRGQCKMAVISSCLLPGFNAKRLVTGNHCVSVEEEDQKNRAEITSKNCQAVLCRPCFASTPPESLSRRFYSRKRSAGVTKNLPPEYPSSTMIRCPVSETT